MPFSLSSTSAPTCSSTNSAGSMTGAPEEAMAERYENILAHLAHQAMQQQREISCLRAQLATAQATTTATDRSLRLSSSDTAALEKLVKVMVRDCVAQQTDDMESELGRRMAQRLRRVTKQHVQKSIDHALRSATVDKSAEPCCSQTAAVSHISPLQGRSEQSAPRHGAQALPQTHTLSEDEITLQPFRPTADVAPSPRRPPRSLASAVVDAATFVTPTKRKPNTPHVSSLNSESPTSLPNVSPVGVSPAVELSSLSSSPVTRCYSRTEEQSETSVADSSAMEFLLSVFTSSEASTTVSTLTDDESTSHLAAGPRRTQPLSALSTTPVAKEAWSRLSGDTTNDITREDGSPRVETTTTTTADGTSATADVEHLIQLFANTSFDSREPVF